MARSLVWARNFLNLARKEIEDEDSIQEISLIRIKIKGATQTSAISPCFLLQFPLQKFYAIRIFVIQNFAPDILSINIIYHAGIGPRDSG